MNKISVPVLIVGGGGAGLTSSMLLSTLGVESMLVSALPHTSLLPKAHVLNQRAMEIFEEVGVADEIYRKSTPTENMKAVGWYAGVTGNHDGYGRCLGKLEAWGGGYTDPDYIAASPCRTSNLPQIRLEPVLKAHAEKLNGNIRFGHELVSLTQDEDGVTAQIRNNATKEEYEVRAQYLLGCDGGRIVGKQVGIKIENQHELKMRMVSTHLSYDFSKYLPDPDVLIRWMVNPDFGSSWASGVLVSMGPDHWGNASEEWVFHLHFAFDDEDAFDDAKVIERMRMTTGIPDFNPDIHYISRWVMEGVLADKFRVGRVFAVGDAAHRHPPTGGLGLTSAVHDAYNLCWKLAAVLKGHASDALLDTYEAERRPVDANNVNCSVGNAMNHFTIDRALNISADKTPEENWAELRPLWENLPKSAEKRHSLNRAIGSQTMEFRHHNVEFGYSYNSKAIIDDGSPAYIPLDPIRLYEPSTKPGHPLPHAWVEREGERVALGTLVHGGYFLLIAGEEGQDWIRAAQHIAKEQMLLVRAVTVGVLGSDYVDVRCSWLKNRAISGKGAVLVRPDRYIAYRSIGEVENPLMVLRQVFGQILAQS